MSTIADLRRNAAVGAIAANSFCMLATSSAANRPHVAGVLYVLVHRRLYINTMRTSRKARNVAENEWMAVCVAVASPDLPDMPPFTAMFQGTAALLTPEDSEISALVSSGRLAPITSHGELELPDSCFIRVTPGRQLITFGFGVSEDDLVNDPLSAIGSVEW